MPDTPKNSVVSRGLFWTFFFGKRRAFDRLWEGKEKVAHCLKSSLDWKKIRGEKTALDHEISVESSFLWSGRKSGKTTKNPGH